MNDLSEIVALVRIAWLSSLNAQIVT